MKAITTVCALALLLATGALGRPNHVEPIYLRRRSNPLEIVEESVESSTVGQLPTTDGTEQQPGSTEVQTTSAGSGTGTSSSTSTQQPSFSFKRPELLKTKIGTSGFVVSTSTKVLTGGASAASGHSSPAKARPQSGEAKANDQLTLFDRYSGHAGVAEPLTDEEYQNELHLATERALPRTTTPREGLSTWVLLSGSDSSELGTDSTSTTRKVQIIKSTTAATTATNAPNASTAKPQPATKRFQPQTTRRIVPTTTSRPARTTTAPVSAVGSEEKKEKFNKVPPKQKIATTTLKPVIVKKVKKPPAPTTTTTSTTTTTTTTTTPKPPTPTTTSTTTTEMAITEASVSTASNDVAVEVAPAEEPSSVESSTFLIMEPKDALFDLPEDRSPAKTAPAAVTKGKKPSRKPNTKSPGGGNKKKPGNKKTRKPEVKDGVAGDKKPAGNKNKPVSTQIINYLSREVMPTVGVGLVGLVMAAGLASYFLGSPLGALRRSDDRKDDLYYSNYEEYAGADGQNEEDVFGKLIAGMPDRAYYRNNAVRRRTQQPVRTGHQYYHVQPYSANKYPHITYRNRAYAPSGPNAAEAMYTNVNRQAQVQQVQQVQAKSQNEFYYNTPPTPYYPTRSVAIETATRQAAPVYSSTYTPSTTVGSSSPTPDTSSPSTPSSQSGVVAAEPIVEPEHEMMPHPEAYSAEHSPEHHAQYVVGSSYGADGLDMYGSVPEHGPRRKRSPEVDDADLDNEIDVDEDHPKDESSAVEVAGTPAVTTSSEVTDDTTDSTGESESTPLTTTTTTTDGGDGHRYTWGDFIRNTVERKVAMGIHFLQHVTMDFQRYLNGVQNQFQQLSVQHHPQHNRTDEHRRQH